MGKVLIKEPVERTIKRWAKGAEIFVVEGREVGGVCYRHCVPRILGQVILIEAEVRYLQKSHRLMQGTADEPNSTKIGRAVATFISLGEITVSSLPILMGRLGNVKPIVLGYCSVCLV